MSQIAAIIGSSKDLSDTLWRIWKFDLQQETVIPLAEFGGKKQADAKAFDLAQSVADLENPATAGSILIPTSSAQNPLPPKLADLFAALAKDIIQTVPVSPPEKPEVGVRMAPDDTVYIVRFPAG
jgi:hypothetical protein